MSLGWLSWRRGASWWGANGRILPSNLIDNCLLNGNFLAESFDWILSFKFLKFDGSVLVQKLVNRKIASSNSNFYIVLFDFYCNSFSTELINSFTFSHEHDLELGALWIIVNEFCKFTINTVFLNRNVHCNSLLKINNILLKSVDLNLCIFELLEELKWSFVGFVNLFFQFEDIVSTILKLNTQIISSLLVVLFSLETLFKLPLHVLLLFQCFVYGQDLAIFHNYSFLKRFNCDCQWVNISLVGFSHFFHFESKISNFLIFLLTELIFLFIQVAFRILLISNFLLRVLGMTVFALPILTLMLILLIFLWFFMITPHLINLIPVICILVLLILSKFSNSSMWSSCMRFSLSMYSWSRLDLSWSSYLNSFWWSLSR